MTAEPRRSPSIADAFHRASPRARLAWLAGAVAFALWLAYAVTRPLGGDSAIFEWGAGVINAGGVMYRDAWDIKGPFVYYLVALVQRVLGSGEVAFRVFDVAVYLAGAVAIARLVTRESASRTAGLFAAALHFLWYARIDIQSTGQPDGWVVNMLAIAVLLASPADAGAFAFVTAGVLIGCMTLVKPFYVAFVLVIVLLALRHAGARARVKELAALAAGVLLPIVVTVAYFAAHGALGDMIEVYLRYTAAVYAHLDSPWLQRLVAFADGVLSRPFALALPFSAFGIAAAIRRNRWLGIGLAVWLAGAAAVIIVQNRLFAEYQWDVLSAPLVVTAGFGIGALLTSPSGGRDTWSDAAHFARVAIWVLLGAAAFAPLYDTYGYAKHLLHRTSRAEYEAQTFGQWGRHPGSFRDAARYVEATTTPRDRVIFIGPFGAMLYYSHRPSATRFAMAQAWFDGDGTTFQRRYRAELLNVMRRSPPTIITTADSSCSAQCEEPRFRLSRFPALDSIIHTDYVRDTVISGMLIWRRTAPASTAEPR